VSSYFFSISQVVAPFFLLSAWALDSVCGSQERSNHAGQIQLGSHLIETLECWNALQTFIFICCFSDSIVHRVNRLISHLNSSHSQVAYLTTNKVVVGSKKKRGRSLTNRTINKVWMSSLVSTQQPPCVIWIGWMDNM